MIQTREDLIEYMRCDQIALHCEALKRPRWGRDESGDLKDYFENWSSIQTINIIYYINCTIYCINIDFIKYQSG